MQSNHYYPYGMSFTESMQTSSQPYKFGNKELDIQRGLNWYDFEKRQMDPLVPGFTTPDPLMEKYYSWSPYAYCAGNPINAVDLRGDSLTFVAGNSEIANTQTIVNQGIGIENVASINNGVLTVSNLSDEQLSKLTPEQQAFYSTMRGAATSEGMVTIGIVSGSEDVFVGSYVLEQIDIADVNAFGTGEGGNKYSTFGHEVEEQFQKQVNNKPYPSAHYGYALPVEDKISGYTRGSGNQNGITGNNGKLSGTLVIPYTNANKVVSLNININNNNIIDIIRK